MSPSPSSAASPSSATKGDRGGAALIPLSWRTGGTDPSREREAERFPIRSLGGFRRKPQPGRAGQLGWWHQPQSIRVGYPKGCCDTLQTPCGQGTISSITHQWGSTGASPPSPVN